MKKLISMLLSIALIASTLCIGTINTKADNTNWQKNAIIAPTEGKLVGAGYMDIVFDTTLENVEQYEVYFDEKNECDLVDGTKATMTFEAKEGVDKQKCEVYTTKVSAHTAYIVAKMNDGTTIQSDTLTFYVSKKGLAMGSDMSQVTDISKLNLSWYYDWDTTPLPENVAGGVDLVPMLWDASEASIDEDGTENLGNMYKLEALETAGYKYLLGFNEPDIDSQANMSAADALKVWPRILKTTQKAGMRTVSPVPAAPNADSKWLQEFMDGMGVHDDAYDVDVTCDMVALHWYQSYPNVNEVLKIIDKLYEKYHKPIWFTEISVVGYNKQYTDRSYENEEARKMVYDFLYGLIVEMEKRDYVERYAWFPYNINSANEIDSAAYSGASAMFDYDTGTFTELGLMYSEIGNPEGYDAYKITESEKFVYVPPTTEPVTTKAPVTTKPITTETQKQTSVTAKKPKKVSIKKATNTKKKTVKLIWLKAKNAKKYQVQYSLSNKFIKAKKYKTVTVKTSKLSYTVKNLKKKKKYYFRVRGVNGKIYGSWSRTTSVKIKK